MNAMDTANLLKQYVTCHDLLRRGFPWEYTLARQFGALLLADMPYPPTVEGIKEMRAHMRRETSVFSGFRGISELMMAMLLYREPNGTDLFSRTLSAHRMMRDAGFRGSTYLPMAAMTLAKNTQEYRFPEMIARAEQFYRGMKAAHFWLTSQDDYVFAVLLACSGRPVDTTVANMEFLYRQLAAAGLPKGNGLQALTHILGLGEEPVEALLARTIRLHRYLAGCRYRMTEYRMPFLGVLALASDTPEALADQAIAMAEELRQVRGFGNFSCDRKTRLMLAGSLLMTHQLAGFRAEVGRTALANSIQAILLAQQAAMIGAVVAASSASAAASSGA